MSEKENWVTIASYTWPPEAQILKGYLESAGIEAFIPEQHTSAINPMATAMQIRVQVRESEVESARALLLELHPTQKKSACPKCKSEEVVTTPLGIKGWVQFVLCALAVVPMRRAHRQVCGSCGSELSR
jgi:hypothetical protein